MSNKELAKKLYSEGNTQAEIARKLGLSRQRVHQIIKDYHALNFNTTMGIMFMIQDECPCEICKKPPPVELHHRDYNNKNTDILNIEPLCKRCHYFVHRKKVKEERLKENIIYHNPYVVRKFL